LEARQRGNRKCRLEVAVVATEVGHGQSSLPSPLKSPMITEVGLAAAV